MTTKHVFFVFVFGMLLPHTSSLLMALECAGAIARMHP
jgi:hypothetical protein